MHGVAHFVAQGGQAVVCGLVIEQHIGRGPRRAGTAVRAGALILRLVNVYPALAERAGGIPDVILSKRRYRLQEDLKRLLDIREMSNPCSGSAYRSYRCKTGTPSCFLRTARIGIQGADATVYRLNQAVIHGLLNLIRIKGRLACARIAARPGGKQIGLDLPGRTARRTYCPSARIRP